MVSVGAIERNILARRQVSVPVVLIARGAEPGSAKCAFGHTCCLPGGWRSLSATLDTRTRFPSRGKSNHVSVVFQYCRAPCQAGDPPAPPEHGRAPPLRSLPTGGLAKTARLPRCG